MSMVRKEMLPERTWDAGKRLNPLHDRYIYLRPELTIANRLCYPCRYFSFDPQHVCFTPSVRAMLVNPHIAYFQTKKKESA